MCQCRSPARCGVGKSHWRGRWPRQSSPPLFRPAAATVDGWGNRWGASSAPCGTSAWRSHTSEQRGLRLPLRWWRPSPLLCYFVALCRLARPLTRKAPGVMGVGVSALPTVATVATTSFWTGRPRHHRGRPRHGGRRGKRRTDCGVGVCVGTAGSLVPPFSSPLPHKPLAVLRVSIAPPHRLVQSRVYSDRWSIARSPDGATGRRHGAQIRRRWCWWEGGAGGKGDGDSGGTRYARVGDASDTRMSQYTSVWRMCGAGQTRGHCAVRLGGAVCPQEAVPP